MSKTSVLLLLSFGTAFGSPLQDPADVKKTPAEQGYRKTKPRMKGATPPEAIDQQTARKKTPRTHKPLADEKPPTYQPQVTPPANPPL